MDIHEDARQGWYCSFLFIQDLKPSSTEQKSSVFISDHSKSVECCVWKGYLLLSREEEIPERIFTLPGGKHCFLGSGPDLLG